MDPEDTAPESKLLINDSEIPPELKADVLEAVVYQYSDGPSSFDVSVNIVSPRDTRLRWVDDARVQPGNKLEIKLGYRDQFESLIVGEITALHAKYTNREAAKLHVQGFDRLHRLRRGRKTRSFIAQKDSQIVQTLATDAGLGADVEDTGIVFDYILQNNLSDLDFLLERARRIRYELRSEGSQLVFRRAANHLAKVATLEYGKTLKQFCPRLTTLAQVDEVKVRSWSPANKQAVLGLARAGDDDSLMGGSQSGPKFTQTAFGPFPSAVIDMPLATQAEADQMAHALYNRIALDFVCGEGESVGNPAIRAGRTIELKGLGQRFGGNYYVKSAEHRVSPKSGYATRFRLARSAA